VSEAASEYAGDPNFKSPDQADIRQLGSLLDDVLGGAEEVPSELQDVIDQSAKLHEEGKELFSDLSGVADVIASLDAQAKGLFSIRWTTPAVILDNNRDGDYKPWKGPDGTQRHPAVGAPVNIAGGSVSALSLVLRDESTCYAIGTGHGLHDDRRGQAEHRVFVPPSPLTVTASPVGKIVALSLLPTLRFKGKLEESESRPAATHD
jgi:hypothetical protein